MKKYVAGFSGFLVEKFVKSAAVSMVQIKSSVPLSGEDESLLIWANSGGVSFSFISMGNSFSLASIIMGTEILSIESLEVR